MIEIPEALTLVKQLNESVKDKHIVKVIANHSPHKFAWFLGDPDDYKNRLEGRKIGLSKSFGGLIEIEAQDSTLVFGDGVNLRYGTEKDIPKKHQLLMMLDDGTALWGSVQMYGGLWCYNKDNKFSTGTFENGYYNVAKTKPSPLDENFSEVYFKDLCEKSGMEKLSMKAFLATEQRIPGLGNGSIQDILWRSGLNPKRKLGTVIEEERISLLNTLKTVLSEMTSNNGRDTERDLYGNYGLYKTVMSKNNYGNSCPKCGTEIQKASYMGGSIYWCEACQPIK